jgi:hypothetical protein
MNFIAKAQFYLIPLLATLNVKLQPVFVKVADLLSVNTAIVPARINSPVAFLSIVLSAIFSVVYFMNHFICHIIAVAYPLLKTLELINAKPQADVTIVAKYWTLFGLIVLFEDTIEFVFALIPLYYYIKFFTILLLMYNNFALSKIAFEFVNAYYRLALANGFIQHKLQDIDDIVSGVNNIDTSDIISSTIEGVIKEELTI